MSREKWSDMTLRFRLAALCSLVTAIALLICLQALQVFSLTQNHPVATDTLPPPEASETPVDQAHMPAVFDLVPTPDATPTCGPTATFPPPVPPADGTPPVPVGESGGWSNATGNTRSCFIGPTVTPGPSPTHGPTHTIPAP
jgi:hypothetical protein